MDNNNKDWLYSARGHYWEVLSPGERYSLLRLTKNRVYKGEYTLDKVCERLNIQESGCVNLQILKQVESGVFRSEDQRRQLMPMLIADLGLSEEEFFTKEKLTKKKPVPVSGEIRKVAETVTRTPEKIVTKTIEKVKEVRVVSKSPSNMVVVNHTEESFIFKVVENNEGVKELHVFDDNPANFKSGGAVWIAPADVMGQSKVRARVTEIK